MPKFIITQTDRYEIEAESIEQARENWRKQLLSDLTFGAEEYLDGLTTYEEKEEN
jgi:hypothetical protein